MNEPELFESELRRLKPARLPGEFESRLRMQPPPSSREFEPQRRLQVWRSRWSSWLRWLAPGMAVVVGLLLVGSRLNRDGDPVPSKPAVSVPAFKADQVEIDRQLLGSFDAVADMPDGEPVRFRFQQWMEAVTLRDSVRGVEVVQRTPRIQVVPVSFATY